MAAAGMAVADITVAAVFMAVVAGIVKNCQAATP
jgi:hypothetical protein